MGWNVDSSKPAAEDPEFVDSMDEGNYVAVKLPKPMGIVFEEVREGGGGGEGGGRRARSTRNF